MRHAGIRAPLPALGALAVALAAGCEYDRTVIGEGTRRVAVHSVLNPGAAFQFVLVEQVLVGQWGLSDGPFDARQPIVTGGGDPVRAATVVLYGPEPQDSAVALETSPGVYQVTSSPAPCEPGSGDCLLVRPGGRYRLRVAPAEGGEVTGATTMPEVVPLLVRTLPQIFDRERDSLGLTWRAVPSARRYALRIESPRGPFTAFLSDTSYRVAGTLRNPLEPTLPSVFMPGFTQEVTVAAVDSNYYDYFRSSSNPFTGTGLINRLQGGVGVFGSWVMLRHRELAVIAPRDEPIEGRYLRSGAGLLPPAIELWVESRARGTTYLSGGYQNAGDPTPRGLLGLVAGDDVTLVFLTDQLASDTSAMFWGKVQSDGSLAGCWGRQGPELCDQRYVKPQ